MDSNKIEDIGELSPCHSFKRCKSTKSYPRKLQTKFNFEGDGIFAFKPIPHRFLCFFVKGKKVIITNAFIKKSDKMPKSEKERALKRKEDYETRTKKEQYY